MSVFSSAHSLGLCWARSSVRKPAARLLLPALCALAACGDAAGGAASLEATIDTVGGVERLTYGDEQAAELPWRFDTTTVIGGFGVDDPDYQFGGLSSNSLAGDADGNLYVLDADGIRVLGYRPDGSLLGSWGREGGGPGELGGGFGGGPRSMAMGPGDTLWVDDRSNQRLTLIPVDGGEASSLALPQSSRGFGGAMSVDSAGVVAILSTFSFSPDDDADGMPPRPIVRLGRDGEVGDTLWTAPPPPTDIVRISSGGNRLMMMMSQQFAPGFHWVRFDDGGIALAESAAYEIRFVDPAGDPERILRRDPPPRPVTEADRQAYLDSLLAPPEEETQFNSAEIRRERAEATTFADSVPRIVGMRRDTRERLWVGVSEHRPGMIERIDVYDRDGTLLGELRDTPLPDHFFADGRAALIDQDELDVQQVHVLRLVETPEALETAASAGG